MKAKQLILSVIVDVICQEMDVDIYDSLFFSDAFFFLKFSLVHECRIRNGTLFVSNCLLKVEIVL